MLRLTIIYWTKEPTNQFVRLFFAFVSRDGGLCMESRVELSCFESTTKILVGFLFSVECLPRNWTLDSQITTDTHSRKMSEENLKTKTVLTRMELSRDVLFSCYCCGLFRTFIRFYAYINFIRFSFLFSVPGFFSSVYLGCALKDSE